MPNWMNNSITLQGTPETLQEIYETDFDFQVLHPCPFSFDDDQDDRWFGWCCKHWGTKWSASELAIDLSKEGDELTISCQTAWYAPHPFLAFLTIKYPGLCIRNEYEEESYEKVGVAEYKDGVACNRYFEPHTQTFATLEKLAEDYDWFDLDGYMDMHEGETDADDEEEWTRKTEPKIYSWTDTYEGLSK